VIPRNQTAGSVATRGIETSGRGILISKIESASEVRAADVEENKILVVFDKNLKKCNLDKFFGRISVVIGEHLGVSQINWEGSLI